MLILWTYVHIKNKIVKKKYCKWIFVCKINSVYVYCLKSIDRYKYIKIWFQLRKKRYWSKVENNHDINNLLWLLESIKCEWVLKNVFLCIQIKCNQRRQFWLIKYQYTIEWLCWSEMPRRLKDSKWTAIRLTIVKKTTTNKRKTTNSNPKRY